MQKHIKTLLILIFLCSPISCASQKTIMTGIDLGVTASCLDGNPIGCIGCVPFLINDVIQFSVEKNRE
jgi:hypothetical protein